jgi:hypothetical protein
VSGVRFKWYSLSSSVQKNIAQELENKVTKIKGDNHVEHFDLVLIDASEFGGEFVDDGVLMKELRMAELILLDDTNLSHNFSVKHALLKDSSYMLMADNPGLREGHAIFRRAFTCGECENSAERGALPT